VTEFRGMKWDGTYMGGSDDAVDKPVNPAIARVQQGKTGSLQLKKSGSRESDSGSQTGSKRSILKQGGASPYPPPPRKAMMEGFGGSIRWTPSSRDISMEEKEAESKEDKEVAPAPVKQASLKRQESITDRLKTVFSARSGGIVDKRQEEGSTLFTVSKSTHEMLENELAKRKAWYTHDKVYIVVFAIMFALCVFSMVYPSRLINLIVNMGPTTNQAGRRRYLTEAIIFFTRELILNDGFSRISKAEATTNLAYYLEELKHADKAVTRGGSKRITIGADARSHDHNVLMYAPGCPWRSMEVVASHRRGALPLPTGGDSSNCTSVVRPDASRRGLHYLYSTFHDAVLTVIEKYGEVDESVDMYAYNANENEDLYNTVKVSLV